jgi:hypothetical protein
MKISVHPSLFQVGDIVRIEKDNKFVDEFEIKKVYLCTATSICKERTKCCGIRLEGHLDRCSYLNREYYMIDTKSRINSIVEIE